MAPPKIRRTWEWHKNAEREFKKLQPPAQAKLDEIVERYREGRERPKEVKKMPGSKINLWEVCAQVGGGWPRILFVKDGTHCVALTVFTKKKNQTEKTDIQRAEGRA